MRFERGTHHPHPPRGPARRPYTVSEAARRQRCRYLRRTRLRSDRESRVIKRLIWQAQFEGGPRESQRTLARQLGVAPSYVHKVQKQVAKGMDALLQYGQRVTLDDLADARRFTNKLREREPEAPELRRRSNEGEPAASPDPRYRTAEQSVAETWREVAEWKCANASDGHARTLTEWREYERRGRRRVLLSIPVR